MNKLVGMNAKGLKVLANRIAKKMNCDVSESDGLLRQIILTDKGSKDFVISIPESGKITGMENISVKFDKYGYTIEETASFVTTSRNYGHGRK